MVETGAALFEQGKVFFEHGAGVGIRIFARGAAVLEGVGVGVDEGDAVVGHGGQLRADAAHLGIGHGNGGDLGGEQAAVGGRLGNVGGQRQALAKGLGKQRGHFVQAFGVAQKDGLAHDFAAAAFELAADLFGNIGDLLCVSFAPLRHDGGIGIRGEALGFGFKGGFQR